MARNRSIRNRHQVSHTTGDELNLTPLLDFLTILLIFLVSNVALTGNVFTILPNITIPNSASVAEPEAGIIIQVSPQEVWVDDQKVMDLTTTTSSAINFDQGGRRIVPLYNELMKKRDEINAINKEVPKAKEFSAVANLIIHQE